MNDLYIFSNWAVSLDWSTLSGVMVGVATLWLAVTAWKGYKEWKAPISLKAKLQLIDDLIDSTTQFHILIGGVIDALKSLKALITTYPNGIIDFMKGHGEQQSQRFIEELNKARPIESQIRVLLIKATLLEFKDSNIASQALNKLAIQFTDILRLASFLSYEITDSTNIAAKDLLKKNEKILNDEHIKNLDENCKIILFWAGEAQKKLLNIKTRVKEPADDTPTKNPPDVNN